MATLAASTGDMLSDPGHASKVLTPLNEARRAYCQGGRARMAEDCVALMHAVVACIPGEGGQVLLTKLLQEEAAP